MVDLVIADANRVAPAPDSAANSPTAQAVARFWRRPAVRMAVIALVLLVMAGVYAPFIANEMALVWSDAHGLRLPLIVDLFNRTSYPHRHDLFFNVAALLLPALGVGGWLLRRRWSFARRLRWGLAALVVAWLVAMAPLVPTRQGVEALWDYRPLSPCTSIAAREAGDAPGHLRAWFPAIPHRFDATYPGASLKAPGAINPATGASFWLGTDVSGRDVAAMLVFGARISLTIGFIATGLSLLIGVLIGAASGYFGGWIDLLLQRLVEIMMCFPTFILILTVVAAVGHDIFIIMLVIGLTSWAGTARLVRGEFLAQAVRDYVTAVESIGVPRWRIMFRHILPNAMAPIVITATFGVAGAVLGESGLSFLGLGDPTTPSWGLLLDEGRENINYAWLIYAPGVAIFVLVTSLNLIGNGLRDAFDPKST